MLLTGETQSTSFNSTNRVFTWDLSGIPANNAVIIVFNTGSNDLEVGVFTRLEPAGSLVADTHSVTAGSALVISLDLDRTNYIEFDIRHITGSTTFEVQAKLL